MGIEQGMLIGNQWSQLLQYLHLLLRGVIFYIPSLGTTLETFNFPETMQVFLNPTPITKSNINLQQKPTTIGLIRYKHAKHTTYATSIAKELTGSYWTPLVTQENLGLNSLHHSLD